MELNYSAKFKQYRSTLKPLDEKKRSFVAEKKKKQTRIFQLISFGFKTRDFQSKKGAFFLNNGL